jgi:hypothetical protein
VRRFFYIVVYMKKEVAETIETRLGAAPRPDYLEYWGHGSISLLSKRGESRKVPQRMER